MARPSLSIYRCLVFHSRRRRLAGPPGAIQRAPRTITGPSQGPGPTRRARGVAYLFSGGGSIRAVSLPPCAERKSDASLFVPERREGTYASPSITHTKPARDGQPIQRTMLSFGRSGQPRALNLFKLGGMDVFSSTFDVSIGLSIQPALPFQSNTSGAGNAATGWSFNNKPRDGVLAVACGGF